MTPLPQGIPSIVHPTTTLCGKDTVEERATRTAPRVTVSPGCGCFGVIPTSTIAQSVSLRAGGGRAGTTVRAQHSLKKEETGWPKVTLRQYGPPTGTDEVSIFAVKPRGLPLVVAITAGVSAEPGHVASMTTSTAVPGGSQVSVPVTVTLGVPCVMVDEERVAECEPEAHAYAGESERAPIIVSARIERKHKTRTGVPFKFYDPRPPSRFASTPPRTIIPSIVATEETLTVFTRNNITY